MDSFMFDEQWTLVRTRPWLPFLSLSQVFFSFAWISACLFSVTFS